MSIETNLGGRPKKYTQEFLDKELEEFYKWMELEDSIYFKSFAIQRKYHPSRLHEFAEEHEGFSRGLEFAKEWQAAKLIQYALFGKTKEGLTKFLLSSIHGMYEEKTETSQEKTNVALKRGGDSPQSETV